MIYKMNRLNEEVLNTKEPTKWLAQILIDKDIDRFENAVKNTYTKDDSDEIIKTINYILSK